MTSRWLGGWLARMKHAHLRVDVRFEERIYEASLRTLVQLVSEIPDEKQVAIKLIRRGMDYLLSRQNRDGSWDVPAGSAEADHTDPTRVYSTAMACLVLDIDLHFLPAYQQ